EKAEEFINVKPLKAVKRALSLAHTIRLDEYVTEGVGILRSDAAATYVTSSRAKELRQKLEVGGSEVRELMLAGRPELNKNLHDGLEGDTVGADEILGTCRDFVNRVLAEVDALEERAKASNGPPL